MSSELTILNEINEIAYLSGVFNWQMVNAKYIAPNNSSEVSFHVVDNLSAPIEQYIAGAINTYNLINTNIGNDPNQRLFNTQIVASNIKESIIRKYAINRVPFANYDQLVDMGTGLQRIVFNSMFVGTMYKTAMQNFIQCAFGSNSGLGTLIHPFYNTIENVLPIEFNNYYNFDSLNCAICEITFLTSDLTHLSPNNITQTNAEKVNTWFIATQNAITSMMGTITALQSLKRGLL